MYMTAQNPLWFRSVKTFSMLCAGFINNSSDFDADTCESKRSKLHRHHCRTCLKGETARGKEAYRKAHKGHSGGEYHGLFKTLCQLHCRERGEHDESGYHNRAHHFHADDYRDSREDCKSYVERTRLYSGSSRKGFIKRHGENVFREHKEPQQHKAG